MKLLHLSREDFRLLHVALPAPSTGIDPLSPDTLAAHDCDAHVQVIDDQGFCSARASLWWTHVPALAGERIGTIGHFAAASAEAARVVISAACDRLRDMKCTTALGPMDGTTWRKYRFVTDSRGAAESELSPFFLEPQNPPEYPMWFEENGFRPLARYSSTLITDLEREDPRIDRARARLAESGITIRSMDTARFDQDLESVYRLSCRSFAQQFLYTLIDLAHFLALYQPLRQHMVPSLVLLAWHGNTLAGYLFGIPDLAQARRGKSVDTVIAKTIAILPGRAYGGLGAVLINEFHRRAREQGFRRCIHALAHEANAKSQHISDFFGTVMRYYTLFSKAL